MVVVNVPFNSDNKVSAPARPALLPAGDYVLRLEDVTVTQTRTGTPMWWLYFSVVGGPQAGETFRQNHVISDAAVWSLARFFEASGFGTFTEPTDIDTSVLPGLMVGAKVVQEQNGSYTNNRVSKYVPVPDGVGKVAEGLGGQVVDW